MDEAMDAFAKSELELRISLKAYEVTPRFPSPDGAALNHLKDLGRYVL